MPDDNKHDVRMTIWLTEREYLDLCKQADIEDRKQSEMARVFVRRSMYGVIGANCSEHNVANSGASRN